MAVISLDLGWSFGWCTWRRGDVIASGVVHLARETAVDGMRLLAFSQWLSAKRAEILAAGETLDDVAYEQITFIGKGNGPESTHAHGKQLGTVQRWCAFYKIGNPPGEPIGVPWNTVKKFVTNHGSASRQLVLKTIRERFPEVHDHNQASAVAVMLTAQNKYPNQPKAAPHARQPAAGPDPG